MKKRLTPFVVLWLAACGSGSSQDPAAAPAASDTTATNATPASGATSGSASATGAANAGAASAGTASTGAAQAATDAASRNAAAPAASPAATPAATQAATPAASPAASPAATASAAPAATPTPAATVDVAGALAQLAAINYDWSPSADERVTRVGTTLTTQPRLVETSTSAFARPFPGAQPTFPVSNWVWRYEEQEQGIVLRSSQSFSNAIVNRLDYGACSVIPHSVPIGQSGNGCTGLFTRLGGGQLTVLSSDVLTVRWTTQPVPADWRGIMGASVPAGAALVCLEWDAPPALPRQDCAAIDKGTLIDFRQ